MKGFALDENGDVLIENGEIRMISGDALLRQKVWAVLRTNLGEWFFDWTQGIDFDNILGKNPSEDIVRYEIERGLKQVDGSFDVTEFVYDVNRRTREAKVQFTAATASGETAGGDYTWH